jgi:hypothetical protein
MYTGPVFAPIRAINNEYGNGRVSMGAVIALTNTVTTVNALAVGNVVGVVVGGGVGAVVGAVIGPVVQTPNLGRVGDNTSMLTSPQTDASGDEEGAEHSS